ncbi:MAG: hypothetical protein IT443_05390 [Phycisphaeraceae bacterium]|nr:hypothetical protein [Phycisphaeraceae bacterium]
MSADASPNAQAPQPSLLAQNHFLLRRLHSLSGIVPIGVFLIFHLFTNFQMLVGNFQHEVEFIHNMPALIYIEILGLWLPIGFHAVLGIAYTLGSNPNSIQYPYMDNWRYTLQRVTGILAFLFIFVHGAKLRWGFTFGGYLDTPFYLHGPHGEPLATASTAIALQHAFPWVLVGYVVGVYACVYHWANGLWTAAISWGLTLSVAAQRRWGVFCVGLGLALAVFSAGAIYKAATYPVADQQREMIRLMEAGRTLPAAPHDKVLELPLPAEEAHEAAP